MIYKKIFTVLLSLSMLTVNAQSAKDSVEQIIHTLFTAMKNADSKLLLSTFADSALLQTVAKDKEGKVTINSEKVSAFASFVAKQSPGKADERITIDAIHVDGDLASVWTPYQFYFDGKFSHCGANSFQLARINKEWKIIYLVDTRRRNCN